MALTTCLEANEKVHDLTVGDDASIFEKGSPDDTDGKTSTDPQVASIDRVVLSCARHVGPLRLLVLWVKDRL